ncbi:hypothetical protein [Xanthomonas euvesicatoria]|uniref:hypothetical protein n=1 Tax=Xanthomonas euvesicatoria TaxID=456327 RepID=UPI001C48E3C8|nr:hypothetical protein [Xanthomonas euvesicatoria]MBV6862923.1 hypothetical protein [Xanthomonas campestris pv. blepharidis]
MRRYLLLAAAVFVPVAAAQSSGEYVRMSRASWSAFECSAYADVLEKSSEHERLFRYGYEQGKAFIEAARAGHVKEADLQSISPSGFLMLAKGPIADFALGRVFEGALENALKDVYTPENILEKDLQKSVASRKYVAANCEFLGRGP